MRKEGKIGRLNGGPAANRQKILDAAYALFKAQGANTIGVNAISARAGVTKMTLYHHFRSKEALVLAFLDLRAERWTVGWLKAEVAKRSKNPRDGLLVIFDLYHEWFQTRDFEGCPFLRVLCEMPRNSAIHKAAAGKLDEICAFVVQLARKAKLPNSTALGRTWMVLMEGAIMSAHGGHRDAALDAKQAALLLLKAWPRQIATPDVSRGAKRKRKSPD